MITFGLGSESVTVPLTIWLQSDAVTVTNLSGLNAAIVEAGPGGTVQIVGEHQRNAPYFITAGGAPGQVVTIRGGTFRSNRTAPWTVGTVNGSVFFALGAGASHLTFDGMFLENVGNGCFQLGAPLSDLTFENIGASNVQRFIENRQVAGQTDASIDGLTVRNCHVEGFSKGTARLDYDTRNILIEDVTGVAAVGDNFPAGIHCDGTVHDGMFRRVQMDDCQQIRTPELYWNADGFSSEELTHHLTWEDCSSSGCTDAGFDLKGNDHTLTRCAAVDNKRNFRLWGIATLTDCVGADPNKRGGTGTQAQIHAAANARVEVVGFTATDCDAETIVFDADQTSQINVSADVTRHPQSTLFTRETGASVTFGDVTDQFCS